MKIGIVGSGGAGITAAWLLDGEHEVTLFERSQTLGGHAHTTVVTENGREHFADDGFCWFSDVLYPNFMRLLELHGVGTRIVPMSTTFTDERRGRTIVMPPVGVGPLLRALVDLPVVLDLIRLNRAISLAEPLVRQGLRDMSWGEFLEKHRFGEQYRREMLTPMVAGIWGGPYERSDEFSVYALMKYFVCHRPSGLMRYRWHVVDGGASSYIETVARSLSVNSIRRSTAVMSLERTDAGWTVMDSHGARHSFDHVIVATSALDARKLLRDVPGIEPVRRLLTQFEYYGVRVATHSDASLMPPRRRDWRVTNVMWNGQRSHLNVWTGRDTGSDVFTSYISDREPRRCHHISHYEVPLITPAHHRAQEALRGRQGEDRLTFAGDWTRDIGCHEDAVTSALEAVEALAPGLARVAALRSPRVRPPLLALPALSRELQPSTRSVPRSSAA